MPQDAKGREPGTPGYQKPPTKKQGFLARLRARARSSRHGPKLVSKEQGASTGSNFKSAAQNRGAAMRELTGDTTPRKKP